MSDRLTVEVVDPSLMPEVLELLEEMGCVWANGLLPTEWCPSRQCQLTIYHCRVITQETPPYINPSDLIIGEK